MVGMSASHQLPVLRPNLQCTVTVLEGGHLRGNLLLQQSRPNGVMGFTQPALLLYESIVSDHGRKWVSPDPGAANTLTLDFSAFSTKKTNVAIYNLTPCPRSQQLLYSEYTILSHWDRYMCYLQTTT